VRAVLALGRIAFESYLRVAGNRHDFPRRSSFRFAHGGSYQLPGGLPRLFASYHPSQQNTQTGRLTPEMFHNMSGGTTMKRVALFASIFLTLFLAGCSKVQTTVLLAEKWETGQHRTCLYGHKNLYCFERGEVEGLLPLSKSIPDQRRLTPYLIESKRAKALEDPRTDGGSYETKFTSHTPMDFSLWDCYKTGVGSPAIVCNLKQKPTKEETAVFIKAEKEQMEHTRLAEDALTLLLKLTPTVLAEACGQGEQTGGQKMVGWGKLDVREDTVIKYPFAEFRLHYWGMYDAPGHRCAVASASCVASYMTKTIHTNANSKFWDIDLQVGDPDAAFDTVQDIPCLANKVK
jgi:hypothetical protein